MEGAGRGGSSLAHIQGFLSLDWHCELSLLLWNLCKHRLVWNGFPAQQGPGKCQTVRLFRRKSVGVPLPRPAVPTAAVRSLAGMGVTWTCSRSAEDLLYQQEPCEGLVCIYAVTESHA